MKTRMRDGSGQRLYRFLCEDTDRHGNVRVYFRRKGQPKIRLIEKPGTEAFDQEYQQAYRGASATTVRPGTAGSLRWLCERYYASAVYCELKLETRRVRRRILDQLCQAKGELPYRLMEARHVAQLRDEKAEAPESANSRVKALRQLFRWACDPEYGHAERNPAAGVRYLKPNNPDGHRPWPEDDVLRYEARHPIGTKARLALDLFLYTGVRISDVVRLGPQMERNEHLIFNETKGGNRIVKTHVLPILPPLRVSIDATPTGHLVYLATAYGRPHTPKGLGNWFKRQCRIAGVDADLSAHGLRKLGAERCVEAGATEHQLRALFGWTTGKQSDLYTRRANRAKLESEAAPLLQQRKSNENAPLRIPVGHIRAKKL